MPNEHNIRYRYPMKTFDFSIFGHSAQIRAFREEGELDSYFFTVGFPNIRDEDNDGFILEKAGDVYRLEAVPNIESKKDVEIRWNIGVDSMHDDPLVAITIKIGGTPVNDTLTFWRSSFPKLNV